MILLLFFINTIFICSYSFIKNDYQIINKKIVYSYQDRNIETYKLTNIEDSLYLEYDSDRIEFSQTAVSFSYIK